MAGEENGEGDAMSFVAAWVAGTYSSELASASAYNDLYNTFRSKYGRNALGLRNALQHYVKLGEIETSKGNTYSQIYSIVGAAQEEDDTQEVLALQTDDHIVVTNTTVTYPSEDQPSTASQEAKPKAKRTAAASKPRLPKYLVKVDTEAIKEEKKVVKKQVVQDVAIKQLPKIPKLPRPDGQPAEPSSPPQTIPDPPAPELKETPPQKPKETKLAIKERPSRAKPVVEKPPKPQLADKPPKPQAKLPKTIKTELPPKAPKIQKEKTMKVPADKAPKLRTQQKIPKLKGGQAPNKQQQTTQQQETPLTGQEQLQYHLQHQLQQQFQQIQMQQLQQLQMKQMQQQQIQQQMQQLQQQMQQNDSIMYQQQQQNFPPQQLHLPQDNMQFSPFGMQSQPIFQSAPEFQNPFNNIQQIPILQQNILPSFQQTLPSLQQTLSSLSSSLPPLQQSLSSSLPPLQQSQPFLQPSYANTSSFDPHPSSVDQFLTLSSQLRQATANEAFPSYNNTNNNDVADNSSSYFSHSPTFPSSSTTPSASSVSGDSTKQAMALNMIVNSDVPNENGAAKKRLEKGEKKKPEGEKVPKKRKADEAGEEKKKKKEEAGNKENTPKKKAKKEVEKEGEEEKEGETGERKKPRKKAGKAGEGEEVEGGEQKKTKSPRKKKAAAPPQGEGEGEEEGEEGGKDASKKSPKKRKKQTKKEAGSEEEGEKQEKGKKVKTGEEEEDEEETKKGKDQDEQEEKKKPHKKKGKKKEEDEIDGDYDDKKKPKPKKRAETKPKGPEKVKYVWAKIKSYPWWPARAVRLEALKGTAIFDTLVKDKEETPNATLVQFFGTNDYAWIPRNCIKRDFVKEYRNFSRNIPPENAPDLEPAIEEATENYVATYGSFPTLTGVDDECCQVCKSPDNADKMLLCDRCDAGYHIYCLAPPIQPEDIPETNWYCDDCIKSETDIDARSLVTSTIIEPGVVGLVNLGSTCYINSSVQCLNSFAAFVDVLLQNLNTSALAIPVLAPYGTTNRTRGKSAKERSAGGDDEEDSEEEEEEDKKEEAVEEESGKGKGKGRGKKGKGKANEEDEEEEQKAGGKGKGKEKEKEKDKGKEKEKEKSEGEGGGVEVPAKGKPITDINAQAAATRVHDYVATFKAVLYHIWHSSRGVDRAVLHGLRLASGYALDFKYFRNQHQDINEYLMHALEYLHTHDHRLLTSSSSPPPSPSPSSPSPSSPSPSSPSPSSATPSSTTEPSDDQSNDVTDNTKNNKEKKKGKEKDKEKETDTSALAAPRSPLDSNQTIDEATKRWEQHFKENKSIITDSFEGMIAHTRTCPKGHSSSSFEIFRILTLQFPMKRPASRRGGEKLLLADILDNFTQEEKLQCRCSQCGGSDDKVFMQKTSIFRFPSYLIIQLGRFSSMVQGSGDDAQWWSNKITTDVVFPVTGLDMTRRFPNAYAKDPPPIYDLVAVANHRGGLNGGHYYTYAKSKAGVWYRYDDNLVKEIKDVQLVSEFAYMLFYERRNNNSEK